MGTTRPYPATFPVTALDLRRHLESATAFRVALGIYALALGLGLKRFLVWDQISVLADATFWPLASTLHPHTLRWLVMQPAMAAGHAGIAPDVAFTGICLALIWVTVRLLARAGALACGRLEREAALRVWLLLPLAVATLAMNGRLIPAFAGLALLVALHVDQAAGIRRNLVWLVVGQVISLLLMSVTSGAFIVGVAAVAWSWCSTLSAGWRHEATRRRLVPIMLVLAAVIGAICLLLARKAAGFFDDRMLAVLDHGFGHWLTRFGTLPTIAGVIATVGAAVLWAWRWRFPLRFGAHLRVPIAASVIFGLAGYSALATALPVLLLVGVLLIERD